MKAPARDIPHLSEVLAFLPCPTPGEWLTEAAKPHRLPQLLCEHADLELKAAQSALTTIRRYANGIPGIASKSSGDKAVVHNLEPREFAQHNMLHKMSRLAREEMRHFEQVLGFMEDRGITYDLVSSSRYAAALRGVVRKAEPARLVDTLIVGAFIEARSCERFAALAPQLDTELAAFYQSLLKSEARHYQDYLSLASQFAEGGIEVRVGQIREHEKALILEPDTDFRFHSGVPI